MANRSRREHKPPGKFLNFYITDEIKIYKVSPHRHTPSVTAAVPTRKCIDLSGKKKSPAVTNCKSSKNVRNTDQSTPPSISSNSSEIRRSNRRHKPSPKLLDYLQSPLDDRKSLRVELSSTPLSANKKKVAQEVERRKCATTKSVATISPMIRQKGIETPIMGPQNISVELVDCFEALAQDLAKTHPVTNAVDIIAKRSPAFHQKDSSPSKVYKQENDKEISPVDSSRDLKRPFNDDDSILDACLSKHQRLSPNIIRSLTRTKKSPKLMVSLQPTKFYSPPQQKIVRSVSQNKPIKQYPLRKLSTRVPSSPSLPRLSSPRSVRHSPRLESLRLTEASSNNHFRKKTCDSPQQDAKDTLKKFLVMGTKVADSIAETLNHNEADLLSRSSSFEKKCLNLVQALAKHGSDIEEEDMKNVLKLLDEEQKERRIYRQSFLKSLRFSHLTNMALYTQMLQLLRTL